MAMKRLICVSLAVVAATVAVDAAVLTPGAVEVVVPPKAPQTVLFAVREATNFLSRALGCGIPVVDRRTPGRTATLRHVLRRVERAR